MSATVAEALSAAAEALSAAGLAEPRAEAERLLGELLGIDRGGLFLRRTERLGAEAATQLAEWVRRRSAREPLQYVTGVTEFRGLELVVDRRVLIPRPETEGLVDVCLGLELPRGAVVLDVGTGSGCVAVALAVARPDLVLRALDRSAAALEVARINARRHDALERIELVECDLAAPPERWRETIDLVVSNPPYVPAGDLAGLQAEVRDHEPREALVAGPSGLEAYASLAPVARELLRPGGRLALELGFAQARAVRGLVASAGFEDLELREDLQGIPRVLVARRSRS